MGRNQGLSNLFRDQQGVTMILVAIVILVIIGFAALAIDIGHLFVVRNELKNAADAGALAGARVLYNEAGTRVNDQANLVARDAAEANKSEKSVVEVDLNADPPDVQRGHWSFSTGQFTPNEIDLEPVDLWDVSNAELDANPRFINAIRVQTRRQNTPALSFFARVLGFLNFVLKAESVAYIGFVGSTMPDDVDQPIAICRESILNPENGYTCRTGRMINSGNSNGQSSTSQNSGAWTNFSQPEECHSAASTPTIRPYAGCSNNTERAPGLIFSDNLQVTNGMVQNLYDQVYDCWWTESNRGIQPWTLTLPVIICGDDRSPSGCFPMDGAVVVHILWMTRTGPEYSDVPRKMGDWNCTETTNQGCWQEFTRNFDLLLADGTTYVPWVQKTLYFLPDCEKVPPKGITGGKNYGILARVPVLVQ
jgi:hypothetical protein